MNKSKTDRTGISVSRRLSVLVLLLGITLAMGCQTRPELGAWYEPDEGATHPELEFLPDNVVHRYDRWDGNGNPRDVYVQSYRIEGDRLTFTPLFGGVGDERTFVFRYTTPDTMVLQRVENGELQGSPTLFVRNDDFDLTQPQPGPAAER